MLFLITILLVVTANKSALFSEDSTSERKDNDTELFGDKELMEEVLRIATEESKAGPIEVRGIADADGIFIFPNDEQCGTGQKGDSRDSWRKGFYYIDWAPGMRQTFRNASSKGREVIVKITGTHYRSIPLPTGYSHDSIGEITSMNILSQPRHVDFLTQNSSIAQGSNTNCRCSTKFEGIAFLSVSELYYDLSTKKTSGGYRNYFWTNNKTITIEEKIPSWLTPLALAVRKRQETLKIGVIGYATDNAIIANQIYFVQVEKQFQQPFPIVNNIGLMLSIGQRVKINGKAFVGYRDSTYLLLYKGDCDDANKNNCLVMYEIIFRNVKEKEYFLSQYSNNNLGDVFIEGNINYCFYTDSFRIEDAVIQLNSPEVNKGTRCSFE